MEPLTSPVVTCKLSPERLLELKEISPHLGAPPLECFQCGPFLAGNKIVFVIPACTAGTMLCVRMIYGAYSVKKNYCEECDSTECQEEWSIERP